MTRLQLAGVTTSLLAVWWSAMRVEPSVSSCSDAAAVVQSELDAFNRHDVDALVALYAPDVQVRLLPADTLIRTTVPRSDA